MKKIIFTKFKKVKRYECDLPYFYKKTMIGMSLMGLLFGLFWIEINHYSIMTKISK